VAETPYFTGRLVFTCNFRVRRMDRRRKRGEIGWQEGCGVYWALWWHSWMTFGGTVNVFKSWGLTSRRCQWIDKGLASSWDRRKARICEDVAVDKKTQNFWWMQLQLITEITVTLQAVKLSDAVRVLGGLKYLSDQSVKDTIKPFCSCLLLLLRLLTCLGFCAGKWQKK